MKGRLNTKWPVLNTYDQRHLLRAAMPIGGIGTGTISLGGRGDLRDWEVGNRPAKGFLPKNTFFCINVKDPGDSSVTKALEGPLEYEHYEAYNGSTGPNYALPRFRSCSLATAYPLAQALLQDREVPVDVRLEAFNPMIPGDSESSGIPFVLLRYVLKNRARESVKASVCGSLGNFLGALELGSSHEKKESPTIGVPFVWGGQENTATGSAIPGKMRLRPEAARLMEKRNHFRVEKGFQGIFMDSEGMDTHSEGFGSIALLTTARRGVTRKQAWGFGDWSWQPLQDFWNEFSQNGKLKEENNGGDDPAGAIAVSVQLEPGEEKAITFVITWHFPNRYEWGGGSGSNEWVGNHYAGRFSDAWDVALQTVPHLPDLESKTVSFVESFCQSDLPEVVKEAALYNASTLRTQTCFQTADGFFHGWEGCSDDVGIGRGSATHVWNYEQATGFLYGELACSMRKVDFLFSTREDGFMNCRSTLPFDTGKEWGLAAADGQMGSLMRLYREWQLSGDDEFLRDLWPRARKALEFAWIPGGWDADEDGVMEGAQHHTLDTEYFGPNPLIGVWYLGALRAGEEMARHLGQGDFAEVCRNLFDRGSAWIDGNLFNGEYYEQQIRPPGNLSGVAPGLVVDRERTDLENPQLQLGKGCLVDQIVGQCMAHVCGLGYLLKKGNVGKTTRSIMKYNYMKDFWNHLNNSRGYTLNGEQGLLVCSYPHGGRPDVVTGGYSECMTGLEYTAAIGMLQEGQIGSGLKCIEAIRSRFDGTRRSPWNEAECGHHYARAMISWAALTTLTGFQYSGVTGTMSFAAADKDSQWFWSNGYAWGTFRQKKTAKGTKVELKVHHGSLELSELAITKVGSITFPIGHTVSEGQSVLEVIT